MLGHARGTRGWVTISSRSNFPGWPLTHQRPFLLILSLPLLDLRPLPYRRRQPRSHDPGQRDHSELCVSLVHRPAAFVGRVTKCHRSTRSPVAGLLGRHDSDRKLFEKFGDWNSVASEGRLHIGKIYLSLYGVSLRPGSAAIGKASEPSSD